MDEIRRSIEAAIKAKGLSESEVSRRLGKNRAYINQFLDGTQQRLPLEIKVHLADILGMSPQQLGIAVAAVAGGQQPNAGGFAEDAEAYIPPKGHYLAATQHRAIFRQKSRSLDQHPERILPGHLLVFDLNRVKQSEIPSGSVVVVSLYDNHDLARSHGTITRQFIAPNKLITNSSELNEIISLDDPALPWEAVIKGTLLSVIREASDA